jgi:hypothetical protein
VHGLFLGSELTSSSPTIFDAVGPHLWAARGQDESKLIDALDTAFRRRLTIAAKLRIALYELAAAVTASGGLSFYTRGDGIEGVVPDQQSLAQLAKAAGEGELISGVGATRLAGTESPSVVRRRVELNLMITKLAAAAGATREASLQVDANTCAPMELLSRHPYHGREEFAAAIRTAKNLQRTLAAARLKQWDQ